MNKAMPARDRGDRGSATRRASRRAGTLSRASRLVGRVANPRSRAETRKAAGVESGGGRKRASVGSRFDGVSPLVAHLFAGYRQPVVLRQRASSAEHGASCMFLPAHRGHDFLQRYTAFALEHCDNLAGFTALPRRTCFFRGRGGVRLFRLGGLLLRGRLRRRHVGRLWRNGGRNGGLRGLGNDRFGRGAKRSDRAESGMAAMERAESKAAIPQLCPSGHSRPKSDARLSELPALNSGACY